LSFSYICQLSLKNNNNYDDDDDDDDNDDDDDADDAAFIRFNKCETDNTTFPMYSHS